LIDTRFLFTTLFVVSQVQRVARSTSHYQLSCALFDVVEEHANSMQDMHETKQMNNNNQMSSFLPSSSRSSSMMGASYAQTHGHAAREERRKNNSLVPIYDSEDDSEDDDEDMFDEKVGEGARVPQPPSKARGNDLFRGGGRNSPNDSPKQKQIKRN
jgi:hypothetical protein